MINLVMYLVLILVTRIYTSCCLFRSNAQARDGSTGGCLKEKIRTYRLLVVHSCVLAQTFGTNFLLIHILGVTVISGSIVIGVLTRNLLTVLLGLGSVWAYLQFEMRCSRVHTTCKELLNDWKRTTFVLTTHEVTKFQRSCRLIRVQIGTFFFFDRTLVLTTLSIISENTFTLILMYRCFAK